MRKKALSFGEWGIALSLLLTFVGELYRFKGFLLIDLWVPLFVAAYFGWKILKKKQIHLPNTVWPAALFVVLGFASLLINTAEQSWGEFLGSATYGIRWASLFLLSVVVANEEKSHARILKMVLAFGVALAFAGFIQLLIIPDFGPFERLGWDPHDGRLLSTWFDPNFVGAFLAFLLPVTLHLLITNEKWRKSLLATAFLLFIALGLTQSRSAYLAFILGAGLVLLLHKAWKLTGASVALVLLLVLFVPPVQNRVLSLVNTIQSLTQETYTLPDASARLRYGSWNEAWTLFLEKPVLGHGYNNYAAAAQLKVPETHSANGSDSSVLTVMATTGTLGTIFFLLTYLVLIGDALRQKNYGFIGGLCGLFLQSIFTNTLLFALFLVPFWITAGLGKTRTKH